jgi:hypothetical protein
MWTWSQWLAGDAVAVGDASPGADEFLAAHRGRPHQLIAAVLAKADLSADLELAFVAHGAAATGRIPHSIPPPVTAGAPA